ncbi:MAG: LuxR C-terminal-related transcriptional regulator [Tannerella sp.]|jgi:DNA-binding CsgD family transcriptional regulator|nr:LuxR C-terminal-related transcriptional regulator [Tannerella sp.]
MCNRIVLIGSFLAACVFFRAIAQNGELIAIDSLSEIVNNPEIEQREKIKPMVDLAQLYTNEGDSVNAAKFLDEARALARKQKDGKYRIHVLNRELLWLVNSYPRDVTLAYRIIDSLHVAISKTEDREVQALAYRAIGEVKATFDSKYDYSDLFTAISIAEKLPEKSDVKYFVLYRAYVNLYFRTMYKDLMPGAEKYLDLMYRAAEKTGNKSIICKAMEAKLAHIAYVQDPPENKDVILLHTERLEQYISQNGNEIDLIKYGDAVNMLKNVYGDYPGDRLKKQIEQHTENFKNNARNNVKVKKTILYMDIIEASEVQKDYPKAIKLYEEKLIPLDKAEGSYMTGKHYELLYGLYMKTGQYQQAAETMQKSMNCYREMMNMQVEEQRQLAEVKFETGKKENELRLARTRIILFLSLAILGISLSIILVIYFKKRQARMILQKKNAEQEVKILRYEKELTHNRLMSNNLQIMKKNEMLERIMQSTTDDEIVKQIRNDYTSDKSYEIYNKTFGEIHPEFFSFLKRRAAPKRLTSLEMRYCAYVYVDKNSKEMADELNVSYQTVLSNKSDLKKKLKIDRDTSLDDFIQNIDFMSETR